MPDSPNSELIALNVAWLRQALQLIGCMTDQIFATAPPALNTHRVGSHLRHVLEFYECFLSGVESSRIDYDARRRDASVAGSRLAAARKIRALIQNLLDNRLLREDSIVAVRMEDAPADAGSPWLRSSIGRELQALSSHTIHHFALIAVTLAAHGVAVDPEFGMSPSTLRFNAANPARIEAA